VCRRNFTVLIILALFAPIKLSKFASALFRHTAAIFFGKVFSALTKYGAGIATPENTIHDIPNGVQHWLPLAAAHGLSKVHFCPPG
jgi:hypothetical protein